MKYELKFIHPLPLIAATSRIFLVMGFVLAILTFYIVPNPGLAAGAWWQKLLGSLIFTGVYALVVTIVVTGVAVLYNLFARRFHGVTVYLEQSE